MTDPRVEAVDSSAPVTQSFLDQIKAIGIRTIIRYYDHEDETLPGKTLRRGERDAILMNGLKMGVVFQHRNDKFASFTALRGRQDGERSLILAAENAQPRRSAAAAASISISPMAPKRNTGNSADDGRRAKRTGCHR